MNENSLPQHVVQALGRTFHHIVLFSGAGMSAESGIATFRGSPDGLWAHFDPAKLATPSAWRTRRDIVWAWYEARRAQVIAAQPHGGHRAVARLQASGRASVVTQNVDDLHERAGAADVVHLHGTLMRGRCAACARPHTLPAPGPELPACVPPKCTHCGGWVRPDVVWFGERLPEQAVREAQDRIGRADLLLVVGTSGTVQPASGFVELAPAGCVILEINPAALPGVFGRRLAWDATAGGALPLIVDRLMR